MRKHRFYRKLSMLLAVAMLIALSSIPAMAAEIPEDTATESSPESAELGDMIDESTDVPNTPSDMPEDTTTESSPEYDELGESPDVPNAPDDVEPPADISLPAEIDTPALSAAATYSITWDTGYSKSTTTQVYGENLKLPGTPARKNYAFIGWFTAADGGEQVTEDTVYNVAGDTIYYAHWQSTDYFSVTVPAVLSLVVSKDGEVFAANKASLLNNSAKAVEVSSVSVLSENGWTLVPYERNLTGEKVDAKCIGFRLNDAVTTIQGDSEQLELTGDWSVEANGSLPLYYDANVSAISTYTDEQVLTLVFVVNWAG